MFIECLCYNFYGDIMYCCFTGHRPEHIPWLWNEDSDHTIKLKRVLSETIDIAINDGYTDFYCGMARGVDTFAAEIIIEKSKINKNEYEENLLNLLCDAAEINPRLVIKKDIEKEEKNEQ